MPEYHAAVGKCFCNLISCAKLNFINNYGFIITNLGITGVNVARRHSNLHRQLQCKEQLVSNSYHVKSSLRPDTLQMRFSSHECDLSYVDIAVEVA